MTRSLLAAPIAAVALLAPAASAPAQTSSPAARAAFVTHHGHYWSWAGPRSWDAVYGESGIKITSANQQLNLDLGFSSTVCAPSSTVKGSARKYFKQQRQTIQRGPARIVGKSKIKKIRGRGLGPNYFRQSLNIKVRGNGRLFLGQLALDYQVSQYPYCYVRSLSFTAPARGFGGSLRTLLRVYRSLAYFGPEPAPDPRD